MLDAEAEVQRTEKWQLINIKNRNTKQETVETHREECCLVTCSSRQGNLRRISQLLLRIQSLLDVMFGAAELKTEPSS